MNFPELFLESGYINMTGIIETPFPFIFVTGARRTGKTFGAIKYMIDHEAKYIYMRRSGSELDACAMEEFSPYADINKKLNRNIHGSKLGKNALAFYDVKEDGIKVLHAPGLALSTLHNVRGIRGILMIILFMMSLYLKRLQGRLRQNLTPGAMHTKL